MLCLRRWGLGFHLRSCGGQRCSLQIVTSETRAQSRQFSGDAEQRAQLRKAGQGMQTQSHSSGQRTHVTPSRPSRRFTETYNGQANIAMIVLAIAQITAAKLSEDSKSQRQIVHLADTNKSQETNLKLDTDKHQQITGNKSYLLQTRPYTSPFQTQQGEVEGGAGCGH